MQWRLPGKTCVAAKSVRIGGEDAWNAETLCEGELYAMVALPYICIFTYIYRSRCMSIHLYLCTHNIYIYIYIYIYIHT